MKKFIKSYVLPIAILAIFINFGFAQNDSGYKDESGSKIEVVKKSESLALAFADTSIVITPVEQFPTNEGIPAIFNWFLNNWNKLINLIVLLILVLESIVSVVPTTRNFSIFQNIREFLDNLTLFKNNVSKESGGGRYIAKSDKVESA